MIFFLVKHFYNLDNKNIASKNVKNAIKNAITRNDKGKPELLEVIINRSRKISNKAKRPIFLLGGGVNIANANEEVQKLIEKLANEPKSHDLMVAFFMQ